MEDTSGLGSLMDGWVAMWNGCQSALDIEAGLGTGGQAMHLVGMPNVQKL